jgi:hypothetical protein
MLIFVPATLENGSTCLRKMPAPAVTDLPAPTSSFTGPTNHNPFCGTYLLRFNPPIVSFIAAPTLT